MKLLNGQELVAGCTIINHRYYCYIFAGLAFTVACLIKEVSLIFSVSSVSSVAEFMFHPCKSVA